MFIKFSSTRDVHHFDRCTVDCMFPFHSYCALLTENSNAIRIILKTVNNNRKKRTSTSCKFGEGAAKKVRDAIMEIERRRQRESDMTKKNHVENETVTIQKTIFVCKNSKTQKQYSRTCVINGEWKENVRAFSLGNDDKNNSNGDGDSKNYNDVVDDKTTIFDKYDAIKSGE